MWIREAGRSQTNWGKRTRIVLLLVIASGICACNEIDVAPAYMALGNELAPELIERADSGDVEAQLAVGIFYRDAADLEGSSQNSR